jgi:flagellar motility protein MotE (MotC chaperone)
MSEAAVMEKRSTVKKNVGDSKEFAETFKPKKGDAGLEKAMKEVPKKKKRRFLKIIIILLIFVLLIGGAAAALYFSGNLNSVLNLVGLSLPQANVGASLEQREAALDKREADLTAWEETPGELETRLNEQQAALDEKEAQENEEKTFEEILAGLSEQKLAELEQVGVIYSKMDPAAASAIMTELYNTRQIAVIIYYMKPAASALALEAMDSELAAGVTEILMS